jgi:hypothetical protein
VVATGDLTPAQRLVLDRLAETELAEDFYLTGGTALSAFYLHHRVSEDLDLFSRGSFDAKRVVAFVKQVAASEPVSHRIRDRLGFSVLVAGETLKLEFVHYAYDWIEPPSRATVPCAWMGCGTSWRTSSRPWWSEPSPRTSPTCSFSCASPGSGWTKAWPTAASSSAGLGWSTCSKQPSCGWTSSVAGRPSTLR